MKIQILLILLILLAGCGEELQTIDKDGVYDCGYEGCELKEANCRNINKIRLRLNNIETDLKVPISEWDFDTISHQELIKIGSDTYLYDYMAQVILQEDGELVINIQTLPIKLKEPK